MPTTALRVPPAPRRVLVAARSFDAIVAALRQRRPELQVRGCLHTDVTADDLNWADAYVGFKRPPGAASLGRVAWVHCTGAGVDAWLADPGLAPEILLTRTPESFGPAIAEWAIARIFAIQQRLAEHAAAQRAHRWEPRDAPLVAGTRAVVVGTGDVGSAIAAKLAALGVTVTGVSRTGKSRGQDATDAAFDAVHSVDRLADLVGGADWIILALPNTPATRGRCCSTPGAAQCSKSRSSPRRSNRDGCAARRSTCSRWSRCQRTRRCGTIRESSSRRTAQVRRRSPVRWRDSWSASRRLSAASAPTGPWIANAATDPTEAPASAAGDQPRRAAASQTAAPRPAAPPRSQWPRPRARDWPSGR